MTPLDPGHWRHALIVGLAIATLNTACTPFAPSASDDGQGAKSKIVRRSFLGPEELQETSGLAISRVDAGRLWALNDGGDGAFLYAISKDGVGLGRVPITGARNTDWEDLASFRLDGVAYLLIADVGDNESQRDFLDLYWVEESKALNAMAVTKHQRFRYPDGARDCEAIAVDTSRERVVLITKRDIPARVYELPLRSPADVTLTAVFVGTLEHLPRPTSQQVAQAQTTGDYFWQPTGFDISADGSLGVVLTYGAVHFFREGTAGNPLGVLASLEGSEPVSVAEAEAISLGAAAREYIVTGENKHAAIVRVDLQ